MFLTKQILERYEACHEGIEWFERHFPEGAELATVMQMRHVPASFLHWGRLHLTTTADERALYESILKIMNSDHFFECDNIDDCHFIANCSRAQSAQYSYHSTDLKNCSGIQESSKIELSSIVYRSQKVKESRIIVNSNNIQNSEYISSSSYTIGSNNVFDSSLVTNSSFVLKSNNLKDCGFVQQLTDCQSCLFCNNIKNEQFALFNKKIDPTQWQFIYDDFHDTFNQLHFNLFTPWDVSIVDGAPLCYITPNKLFETVLTDEIMHWIKHLPNYNSDILYQITFHPTFLE